MKIFAIAFLACVSLVAAIPKPKFYSDEDIKLLATFSEDLKRKTENFVDAEIHIKTAPYCILPSDCPPTWRCQNMLAALEDMVNATSHTSELGRLRRKAKIHGKECMRPPAEVVNKFTPEQLGDRLRSHVNEINIILSSEENGVAQYGMDVNALVTKRINFDLALPMQRVGSLTPFDPSSLLFSLFATRGMGDSPDIDDSLALILALSSVQQPGSNVDNNLFSNPFLLFSLLGNKNSDSSKDVLLYSLLLSPNGGLGGGSTMDPANTFSNPLILLSLLDKNDGNMNIKDLLPLLLIGGGGAPGSDPSGIGSILPLLLLSSNSSGFGDGDSLLPLLLLSGGLGGAPGSDPHADDGLGGFGGIEQLLPLLLSEDGGLGGGSSSLNDILPLLLLGGGGAGGAGLSSILPLLLLQGGNSSIGSDNNFALLLALSGGLGGGAGGLGSILPLLLLKGSGSNGGGDKDLLSLLTLLGGSGGLGGSVGPGGQGTNPISNILPLLLLLDSGSDNMILILYIFGFLTAVPDPLIAG